MELMCIDNMSMPLYGHRMEMIMARTYLSNITGSIRMINVANLNGELFGTVSIKK
jgi:hypothetical protein